MLALEQRTPSRASYAAGLVLSMYHAARTFVAAREWGGPYVSAEDLVRRAGLDATDRQALAAASALGHIAGDRHRAHWTLLALEAARPDNLFDGATLPGAREPRAPPDGTPGGSIDGPTEGKDVVEDYRSTGLTLGRHPMSLLREHLAERRLTDSAAWRRMARDGDPTRLNEIVEHTVNAWVKPLVNV